MYIPKIEQYNLQDKVLPIFNKTECNYSETSRQLSELAGITISDKAVKRYLSKLKPIQKQKEKVIKKREELLKLITEDDEKAKKFIDLTTNDLIEIYKKKREDPNTTSEELVELADKIFSNKGMDRIYNHHGIGVKGPIVQVNQQFNFMKEKALEFVQIIKEEFNGQSDEIISVIKRRFLANGS